eukprot:EC786020.1.p4 GENE.EC786020.1~~EC786020.1.p4  ORF type:complete len:97 (+),score=22.41 EC786020.1:29-319(+)
MSGAFVRGARRAMSSSAGGHGNSTNTWRLVSYAGMVAVPVFGAVGLFGGDHSHHHEQKPFAYKTFHKQATGSHKPFPWANKDCTLFQPDCGKEEHH